MCVVRRRRYLLYFNCCQPFLGCVSNHMFSLSSGTHNPYLQKMIYIDNRHFLPRDSPLRRDVENFPEKQCDYHFPLPPKRQYSVLEVYHHAHDHAKNKYVDCYIYLNALGNHCHSIRLFFFVS